MTEPGTDELQRLQRIADACVLAEIAAHKHRIEHPALAEIAESLGRVLEVNDADEAT